MLLTALSLAPSPVRGAEVVASVLGEEILESQLAAAGGEPAQIARFRDLIWEKVAQHYIAERGLAATPAELAELSGYHDEFERRDRDQRARKLEELNQRLAAGGLAAEERARLEEFRAVLARMAQNDAESDRAPPDPAREAALAAPWVEWWKMNKALYEQYGGTVALTNSGPAAHGARAALVTEYERRGLVRFLDSRLRERLFALLAAPPSTVVPPDRVDFTPYWKLPIPPSYFPD
jgi:hypothetical protein